MKERNNYLSVIRIIFTFGIVLFHYYFITQLYVLVEGFFYISGYLIAKKADSKNPISTKEYFIGRVKRLFPYYIYAMMVYFVVENIKWRSKPADFIKNVMASIPQFFCLQMFGFSSGHLYNEASWYVAVLLFVGTLVYCLVKKLKKNIVLLGLPISIAIYVVIFKYFQTINVFAQVKYHLSVGLFRGLAGVIVGACVYYLSKKTYEYIKSNLIKKLAIYGLLFFVFIQLVVIKNGYISEFISMVALALSVLLASFPSENNDNKKIINYLDKISYGIFLNHGLILWVIMREVAWNDGGTGRNAAIYVLFVIIYTVVLDVCVKFLKKGERIA